MKRSHCRLYSGPLSPAAQQVLAVLEAQRLHAARQNQRYSSSRQLMVRHYGSQTPWAQSSMRFSQEETRDPYADQPQMSSVCTSCHDNQMQNSPPSANHQYSHTPDSVLSSQASSCSSSCWDSSLQSPTLQAETCYQHSQTYSHRKYPEPPAYQSSRALSFTQREVSEAAASFSHTDRYTLSLQTPETLSEHQATMWRNSREEIRPSFTLDLSPEVHTEDRVFTYHTVKPSCIKESEETYENPSSKEKWPEMDSTESRKILEIDLQDTYSQSQGKRNLSNMSEVALNEPEADRFGTIKTGGKHPSPQPLRHVGGKKEVEQVLYVENSMKEVTGSLSEREHEVPDDINGIRREVEEEEEEGQEDATEPSGDASASEMEGVLLVGNSVMNLCLVSLASNMDKSTAGDRKEEYHANSLAEISLPVERDKGSPQAMIETSENHYTEGPLVQPATLLLVDTRDDKGTTEERIELMEVGLEVVRESKAKATAEDKRETELLHNCSDVQPKDKQCDRDSGDAEKDAAAGEKGKDGDELGMPAVDGGEDSRSASCPAPVLSQECKERQSSFRNPCIRGNHQHHDNHQAANGSNRGSSSSIVLVPASSIISRQGFNKSSSIDDLVSTAKGQRKRIEHSILTTSKTHLVSNQPPLMPSFTLKRKHQIPRNAIVSTRPPPKWEPPRSFQERKEVGGVREQKRTRIEHSPLSAEHQPKANPLHEVGKVLAVDIDSNSPKQTSQSKVCHKSGRKTFEHTPSSVTCKPPEHKRTKCGLDHRTSGPETSQLGASSREPQNQSKAGSLTSSLTSDPRIKDSGKMSEDEKMHVLEKADQSKALVLTMVYRDGSTQLDREQKPTPAVCGLLLLMKNDLDQSSPEESLGPNDSLVYFKLEHTPAWAQQHTHHRQELFTRDMLLQVLSKSQLVVCFRAKEVLRVALQFYRRDLTWKQVAGCHIQDPQVSGWLLDPADPASCFQDLLNKHCKKPRPTPAIGSKKVSQIIGGLSSLYWLNVELCSKLQSQGLWKLYSDMELHMIPVLAAMESHHIHVDKEALKRTSDLLGTKMKQLEKEAHQAAGQMFLLTSSSQLRTVLFEKLRLHERCDNKKLPKTINKQQQSTSEAALLQLQDLHPLPKIILEYRQVHKIKSTFVDGILSCMMTKNYISSTWYQTSAVTGRISSKHPNFQALPRQSLQITKKQHIQGKEEAMVTVHPRAMFIPQDGWTFLAADFCQVELRLLAHLSSDPELLGVFTNPKADVFTMLASQWKGVGESEVTSEDREHAKRIVYSVVYGAGPERLSGILGVSVEQARRFQDSFLQTYREVQAFIQKTIHQCQNQGHVLSIMGRRRTLPNINSPDWGVRMQAERQAVNFVVQGSAADLCKTAMIRIFNLLCSSSSLSARLIAQLHDELLYEVEDSQVEQFAALVKSTMESLQRIDQLDLHLKVPLKVAVSSGKSWGSMSELNVTPSSPSP